MKYYLAFKKEILPFETTWMNPEDIRLRETRHHRDKNTLINYLSNLHSQFSQSWYRNRTIKKAQDIMSKRNWHYSLTFN